MINALLAGLDSLAALAYLSLASSFCLPCNQPQPTTPPSEDLLTSYQPDWYTKCSDLPFLSAPPPQCPVDHIALPLQISCLPNLFHYPKPQFQQLLPGDLLATPAREAANLSADVHHHLSSSQSVLPASSPTL